MTIPKNIKSTLRYQHLVARIQGLPAYRQEEALRKEITNGPQWRIDATIEAINKNPGNWNYIHTTEVMKHAAMLGRLQTVEKISDSLGYEKREEGKRKPVAPRSVQAAFHIAARHGRYRTADALYKRGAGAMFEAEGTSPAIYGAVDEGNLRKIDYLLHRDAEKDYLVNVAAGSKNYMKVTKYLIERKGASANGGGDRFNTPFLTALKYGREDLVEYLLSHGATPQLDKSAGEAIYHAVGTNNVKMASLMLEIGFKPDQQTLQHAVYGGHVDAAKLLVEKAGLKMNEGKQEVLMLAIAATKNAPEMTKLALDNGADAKAALEALKADKSLYQYGNREKMIGFLENHLAPKAAPAAPAAPKP